MATIDSRAARCESPSAAAIRCRAALPRVDPRVAISAIRSRHCTESVRVA
jgi:hypothetical protein